MRGSRSRTQTICLLTIRRNSSRTELLATAPMATRKMARILRPRSTTSRGTVATRSVKGPAEDSVVKDAGIRAPERLAAVVLSV